MTCLPAVENVCRNGIHSRRRAPILYEQVHNDYKNNNLTRFKFKLTITLFFSYVNGRQRIGNNKKCRRIACDIDCHVDAAVRRGPHRPIEHIQGVTQSHWMPPSGECLRRIAPAAAMVDGFVETTLNTTKTKLLASNYGTFCSLIVCENFNPKTDPLLSSSIRLNVNRHDWS